MVVSMGIGAVSVSPGAVLSILAAPAGVTLPWAFEPQQYQVIWGIRLPRVILGALVGASLSICGALLQGLFRNPLADPGLVGVSSGAALGAATMIVLGGALPASIAAGMGVFSIAAAAFIGGGLTTALVFRLATQGGRTSVETMLLAGIALNALCGAGTGLLVVFSNEGQLRDLSFWTMGSLGGGTWPALAVLAPCVVLVCLAAPRLAGALNAMLLGEAEARHLGIRTQQVKRIVIALTALAVGVSTAISGLIGFVGLVGPHLIRLTAGPDHRMLLPASALLGASMLVLADVLARTVMQPAEVPIGILTALAGAPFFLYLLLRKPRQAGSLDSAPGLSGS